MGAVIDESAFTRTQADAFDMAKKSDDAEIVVGGDADDSDGYFVEPDGGARPRSRVRPDAARSSSGRS